MKAILTALHDEAGHRRKDATVKKILERYWWKNVCPQTRDYDHEKKIAPGRCALYRVVPCALCVRDGSFKVTARLV